MDESQIKLCRQGELELLEELVRLRADSLYHFFTICAKCRRRTEAVQDTWVGPPNFRCRLRSPSWLVVPHCRQSSAGSVPAQGRWTILATLGNPPPQRVPKIS